MIEVGESPCSQILFLHLCPALFPARRPKPMIRDVADLGGLARGGTFTAAWTCTCQNESEALRVEDGCGMK